MTVYLGTLGPALDWLPEDTEEEIAGASSHQAVIVGTDTSINLHCREADLPWFVGNQLRLIIPRRDGGTHQPSPDIVVHPTLGQRHLPSLAVADYGPPALAIEVASPGTAWDHDLNTLRADAKPRAYAECGIAEYLVYDPLGDLLPERIRAWRLGQDATGGATGGYVPWLPAADGRWHSRALGIAFAPEAGGILLRVYAPDGRLIPTADELARQLRAERATVAAQAARIAALEDELRRRGG